MRPLTQDWREKKAEDWLLEREDGEAVRSPGDPPRITPRCCASGPLSDAWPVCGLSWGPRESRWL